MTRILSKFKKYFLMDFKSKKLTIKDYLGRFNERWYKDVKFRFKCGLIFISTIGTITYFNSDVTLPTQTLEEKKDRELMKSETNLQKNKTHKSLDELVNKFQEKVELMIKKVNLFFKEGFV